MAEGKLHIQESTEQGTPAILKAFADSALSAIHIKDQLSVSTEFYNEVDLMRTDPVQFLFKTYNYNQELLIKYLDDTVIKTIRENSDIIQSVWKTSDEPLRYIVVVDELDELKEYHIIKDFIFWNDSVADQNFKIRVLVVDSKNIRILQESSSATQLDLDNDGTREAHPSKQQDI